MGEPLLHPNLAELFEIAGNLGFKVIITTNGTLLGEKAEILTSAKSLHKVSISLHSFEANKGVDMDGYLEDCFDFAEKATSNGIITVFRLWNIGGLESFNEEIVKKMHRSFDVTGDTWYETRNGFRIKDKLFLEWGQKFDWPDTDAEVQSVSHFCYGLRDQLGVLCDGTVVPCCLDHDGDLALGNLFQQTMDDILESPRAQAIYQGFSNRQMVEPLCRRCGYARRFSK
jgi:radical SAM protein with 4Fe4S-binding SPASM domain